MSSPTARTYRTFKPSRPAPSPPSNPPAYSPLHSRARSYTSLDSESTCYTPETTPTRFSRHTSPASPLNTRLTPPRAASYPPPPPRAECYVAPPADLSLFDHRQRQTLLGDIEFIIGKKLRFPMLTRKDKSANTPSTHTSSNSDGGKKLDQRAKLRKERPISDDEIFWSGLRVEREEVVVVEAATHGEARRKGRGVREGNWV